MQPTSHAPQEHQERPRYHVSLPRHGARPEVYPGPYARHYPGPSRPFPEQRRRKEPPVRMPPTALAAGVLGVAGVLPLALLVGTSVALGGLWADNGVEWWLYPLLLAPVLELWGAIQLLTRRSWWVPALTFVPGAVLFVYLMAAWIARDDGGLGWYTVALVCPLVALVCVLTPSTREWVSARRRAVVRGVG